MSGHVFVHIGDTHLHPNPRNVDRLRALDQVIAENIERENLAAWLWPGDLFHARSTIEDRNALAERMQRMAAVAPICVVYGNHDLGGDLDVFAKLKARWPIYVIATPDVLQVPLATGQTAVMFCLPYPNESGLVSAGVAPGDMVGTARQALDAIFMYAGAQLAAARQRGAITLAIGHVNIAGSIASTGQPQIGKEIELDAALIARLGECYIGVNHIHKAQQISGAWYPGSIARLDWGETDPKGYLRITYAPDGNGFVVETCPIDVPPMYHVEGVLSRDGFKWTAGAGEVPVPQAQPATWKGYEVRVRARYHQSEKGILDFAKAHLFADFAEAKRFELELVAVPDTALRAPEVAAAKTLAEKVAAWATETRTVLPADLLAALPALEHGDPDTIIAGEQALMDDLLDPTAAEEERAVAVA